ncbi:MAG: hypothetical protein KDH94_01885, partial [Coxiellaceae bacterium]|nr:hypothetical protein [Coxiellaceae bacterium]
QDGQPTIQLDKTSSQWVWVDPKTGDHERYNQAGQLTLKHNAKGQSTEYFYEPAGKKRLAKIYCHESQASYEIIYDDKAYTATVQYIEFQKSAVVSQVHTFTAEGLLNKTTIYLDDLQTKEYTVQYQYYPATQLLQTVSQTDNTAFNFIYQSKSGNAINNLDQIRFGTTQGDVLVSMQYPSTSTTTFGIMSYKEANFKVSFDPATGKLEQFGQATGVDWSNSSEETCLFEYLPSGQLSKASYSNGSAIEYDYGVDQLRTKKTVQPQGKITVAQYVTSNTPKGMLQQTDIEYQAAGAQQATVQRTRYVYDPNFKIFNVNISHAYVLRFVLSPTGIVTEHQYNVKGDRTSTRIYRGNRFDLYGKSDNYVPTLKEMETWVAAQDPSDVDLQEYLSSTHGLILVSHNYANVDSQGAGVSNNQAGSIQNTYNINGVWTSRTNFIVLDKEQRTVSRQVDGLGREIQRTDQGEFLNNGKITTVKRTKTIDFDDAKRQLQVTQYNDRKDVVTDNFLKLPTVKNQGGRKTEYLRDQKGLLYVTVLPDQQREYYTYDVKDRVIYTINVLQNVVEVQYHDDVNYQCKIEYYNAIALTEFLKKYNLQFANTDLVQSLVSKVVDPKKDRYSYQFFDPNGNLLYTVDPEGSIIETVYDPLGRVIQKIAYSDEITSDELALLKQQKALGRTVDYSKDRSTRQGWNTENRLIGTQDSAGYVTIFSYTSSGHVAEEMLYATKAGQTLSDFEAFIQKPVTSEEDITIYQFWDGRGIQRAKVDGDDYLTEMTENSAGKIAEKVQYATAVTLGKTQPTPVKSDNDQASTYAFDGYERPDLSTKASGLETVTQYDVMDQPTLVQQTDSEDKLAVPRSVNKRRNAWSELTAECNPYVSEKLVKAQDKDKVWQDDATQYDRDATGLLLSKKDSRGNKTFFYYDAARRLRFTVDARGAVLEKKYNGFSETVFERSYDTLLSKEQLITVQGGFLTAEVIAVFKALESKQDSIYHYDYNRRGEKILTTDPEQYQTITIWNAFGEKQSEEQCVETTTPSLAITYEYDTRGNVINKTESSSTTASVTELWQYSNAQNKMSLHTNALGGVTHYYYDKRAYLTKTVDPLGATHLTVYDAFGRAKQETLASGAVIKHQYQLAKRSHVIEKYDTDGVTLLETHTVVANAYGDLHQSIDANQQVSAWTYGPGGNIITLDQPLQGVSSNLYDFLGNQTGFEASNGDQVQYGYDSANNKNLTIIGVGATNITTKIEYNASNHRSQLTDPNQVVTSYQYNPRQLRTQTIVDNDKSGLQLT